MTDLLAPLTAHPQGLLLTLLLASLLESLALVGLLLPGVALLFALAVLAGSGGLPLPLVLGAALLGALLGDGLSFLLGRLQRERVRDFALIRRHPYWLSHAEEFFHRHGGKSLVLGRFIGPLRPVVPLVAGMLGYAPGRYLLLNIGSGLVWAPAYLLPGYLVGASIQWQADLPDAFWWLLAALGTLAALLALPMLRPTARLRPLLGAGLTLALAVLLGAQLLGLLDGDNQRLYQAFEPLRTPLIEQLFLWLTLLGNNLSIALLLLPALLLTVWLEHWRGPLWLAAALLSLGACVSALKWGVALPRPEGVLYPGFSFPSGHSAGFACLTSLLALLLSRGQAWLERYLIWALLLFAGLLMALSRLLLGVHWPGDVAAGWLLGQLLAWLFWPRIGAAPWPRRPLWIGLLLGLALMLLGSWEQLAAARPLYLGGA